MSFNIIPAGQQDLTIISELAGQIWWPTYREILSEKQIRFMLADMYAVDKLEKSCREGQNFFLAYEDGLPVGFVGLKQKENDILRIEKLYLLPSTQGKGYGKLLISFAESFAKDQQKNILELNVNRGNKAFSFYKKQGFEIVEEVDIPYYEFVLDDYVMQKSLS